MQIAWAERCSSVGQRWEAEIAEMRRVLAGLAMKEKCKWGKPTYTVEGKNIVIMQGLRAAMRTVASVSNTKRAYGVDGGRICKRPGSSSRTASTNTRTFAAGVPVR